MTARPVRGYQNGGAQQHSNTSNLRPFPFARSEPKPYSSYVVVVVSYSLNELVEYYYYDSWIAQPGNGCS